MGSSNVTTVDECATACQQNSACEYFAFCPTSQSGGCLLPAQGSNLPSFLPAGQCTITGDAVANRTAVLTVLGDGVKFESGARIPGSQATNASEASPSPSPSPSPAAAGAPSSPVPNPDDPLTWVDPAPDGPKEVSPTVGLRCRSMRCRTLLCAVRQPSSLAGGLFAPPLLQCQGKPAGVVWSHKLGLQRFVGRGCCHACHAFE